jgi:hypothetical protein
MFRLRKNKLVVALIAALVTVPSVAAPLAIAGVNPHSHPVVRHALLPRATRAARRRLYATVRMSRWRSPRRRRDGGVTRRPRRLVASPRSLRHAWQARGPPGALAALRRTKKAPPEMRGL